MERRYVDSTGLLAVRYQPYTGVLEIAFHNGHIYQYFEVPGRLYTDLMHAPSRGQYFNYHIRNQFPFRQIR